MIAPNKLESLEDDELDRLAEMIAERVAEKVQSRLGRKPDEILLDRFGLSKAIGLSVATIDRRVRDNAIPYFRSGRRIQFRLSDVLESLASNAINGTAT